MEEPGAAKHFLARLWEIYDISQPGITEHDQHDRTERRLDHMKVKIIDAGSVGARMNSILFVLHCRDKTIKILTGLELG